MIFCLYYYNFVFINMWFKRYIMILYLHGLPILWQYHIRNYNNVGEKVTWKKGSFFDIVRNSCAPTNAAARNEGSTWRPLLNCFYCKTWKLCSNNTVYRMVLEPLFKVVEKSYIGWCIRLDFRYFIPKIDKIVLRFHFFTCK